MGEQLKKGGEGCLALSVSHLPALCLQQGMATRSLWCAWMKGLIWMSEFSNTQGKHEHRPSWDEINHGPEINSWRCVSLIPGSHWVHVIPAFFHLICPPDLPEMDIFMFSFHMMLFSPLFLWKHGCKLSVILGQKTICDRMWLQMIDCFFLLTQIYEFNIII